MSWLVICAVLILGVVAYRRHISAPSASARRKTYAWAWAFWGALIGSFFGIAGFGAAIAGTSIGAILGYLAASTWMKVDITDQSVITQKPRSSTGIISAIKEHIQAAEHRAIQEHNAPIREKISSIDEDRRAAMAELYAATASPRKKKRAATALIKLDKRRAALVRRLR